MPAAFETAWTGASNSGSTSSQVLAGITSVGNFIAVSFSTSGVSNGVVDSKGNSYQLAYGPIANGGDNNYLYYAENATTGASHTITVNTVSNSFISAAASSYSGMLTSGTLDKTASATGTGTALLSGTTATTAQADELLLGSGTIGVSVNSTWTAGALYMIRSNVALGNSQAVVYLEDRIVSATGTYNAGATWGASSGNWAAGIATFKAVAGGAPDPVIGRRIYVLP